jgi:hypothetical protein
MGINKHERLPNSTYRRRHDIAEILLKMALKHPKINFNEAPFVKVKQYINAITKMELNIGYGYK